MSNFRILSDDRRGSGRTHSQIVRAPLGAMLVHPTPAYAKMIANKVGRTDLTIVGQNVRRENLQSMRHIVLDHSLEVVDPFFKALFERSAA